MQVVHPIDTLIMLHCVRFRHQMMWVMPIIGRRAQVPEYTMMVEY